MNNIFGVRIIEEYVHMCHDGVRQGWHERNGGNLTYRMKPEEVTECRPYFRERPGDWVDIGVQAENLKGEYFIPPAAESFCRMWTLSPRTISALWRSTMPATNTALSGDWKRAASPPVSFPPTL